MPLPVSVTDDFSGALTTTGLGGRATTTGGQTWSENGAFAADQNGLNIDGAGGISVATSNGSMPEVEVGSADHHADLTLGNVTMSATNFMGPAVRLVDQNNLIWAQPVGATDIRLYKRVGSSTAQQVAGMRALTTAWAAGDIIRTQIDGTSVTVWLARAATPDTFVQLDNSSGVTSWTVSDAVFSGVSKAGVIGKGTLTSGATHFSAGPNVDAPTLTISSGGPAAGRVLQRHKTTGDATITPAFAFTGTTPANIRYRIETGAGAQVVDWTTLGSASIGASSINDVAVTLSADTAKGDYVVKFQTRDSGGTVLASAQTDAFTVGEIILGLGQSNMVGLFSSGSDSYAGTKNRYFNGTTWSQPTNHKGAAALAAAADDAGFPIGVSHAAVSGQTARAFCPAHTSTDGAVAKGVHHDAILARITAMGGDIGAIDICQGETFFSGQTQQQWVDAWAATIAAVRAHVGRTAAQLPVFVSLTGNDDSGALSEAERDQVRAAQQQLATDVENVHISHDAIDYPLKTGEPHYTDAYYPIHGAAFGESYASYIVGDPVVAGDTSTVTAPILSPVLSAILGA